MGDLHRATSARSIQDALDADAFGPTSTAGSAFPHRSTLMLLAGLFFVWGFAAVLNNTLLPHLRAVFDFSYTQEMMIGSVWFIAFLTVSLPAARLIKRIGHGHSAVAGLLTMAGGALLMIPAAAVPSYAVALTALFAIAAGATLLEVSANPYVAVIGPPETASSRLNLVQAFNSMGTTLAPLFGGWLILARSRSGTAAQGAASLTRAERLIDAHAIALPYLLMASVLAILAVVILQFRFAAIPVQGRRPGRGDRRAGSLWRHRNLVWGVPAISVYEVAEVGCANLFINFAGQSTVGHLTHAEAADRLFLLWGGMMVGRLGGSALMRRVRPERVLAGASVLAFLVMLATVFGTGSVALWALISVGLFHSIMFPTIFTMAIRGLGPLTEAGSGLLIMAIGGGVLVVAQGWLADLFGPQASFLLPAACELYVLFYALWGSRTFHDADSSSARRRAAVGASMDGASRRSWSRRGPTASRSTGEEASPR